MVGFHYPLAGIPPAVHSPGVSVVLVLAAASTAAKAGSITYSYSSGDFTTLSAPYTGSDYVSGSIVFSSLLPDNSDIVFDSTATPPVSFTFSDGVQTLTSADASLEGDSQFVTDGTGQISAWRVVVLPNSPADFIITSFDVVNTEEIGTTSSSGFSDSPKEDTGYTLNGTGVWTASASGSSTPEPSTLALLGAGIAMLGLCKPKHEQPRSY
jgi:hypothetical protein